MACEICRAITRHCVLGDRVVVHPFAVLGGDPQYLKFDRAHRPGVRIGAGTVIREHVTINRSIHAGGFTTVGENCFFMAASHVGARLRGRQPRRAGQRRAARGPRERGRPHVSRRRRGGAPVCRIGEGVMVAGTRRSRAMCRTSRWWRSATT
jgi:UDP-N-acetylglucosamine acyltransferase